MKVRLVLKIAPVFCHDHAGLGNSEPSTYKHLQAHSIVMDHLINTNYYPIFTIIIYC